MCQLDALTVVTINVAFISRNSFTLLTLQKKKQVFFVANSGFKTVRHYSLVFHKVWFVLNRARSHQSILPNEFWAFVFWIFIKIWAYINLPLPVSLHYILDLVDFGGAYRHANYDKKIMEKKKQSYWQFKYWERNA